MTAAGVPGYSRSLIDLAQLKTLVSSFHGDDKSRERVSLLLDHTPEPFSRAQFAPGHITCTGLVLHPDGKSFLLVHHRRLNRWLLPGGHVEPEDLEISDTARREVIEETGASLVNDQKPQLVGIDVHGIPPGRGEPFHLHHDLIFAFQAASDKIGATEEVRDVVWCGASDWERYDLPANIRAASERATRLLTQLRSSH